MFEGQKREELNLIDEKEFQKRLEDSNKRNGKIIIDLLEKLAEDKTSWGTIIEKNAEIYSENLAVKFEDIILNYKQFNKKVNQYANYFISLGLKKGDVVELLMTNRLEYLLIFTAIGKTGAIGSLINYDLRESSLNHCLNIAPGKLIIVGENCYEAFDKVKTNLTHFEGQKWFFVSDQGLITPDDNYINLSEAIKEVSTENPSTTTDIKSSDPLAYIFTSGTTGLPKASIFLHSRMVGSAYLIGLVVGELNQDDTMYIPLPLFHTTALCLGWAAAVGAGAAVALSRRFSVSRFWDDIRKFDATAFNYVGEMCRYLINQPVSSKDSQNKVKTIIGNGLRPDIWMDFKKRFTITRVAEFYGASEIGITFSNSLNFDCTVGYCASPYAIVKFDYNEEQPVRDENGFMERVGLGETGLLLWDIQTPGIFVGYTDKKASEDKIFRNVFEEGDIWFNTGDILRDQGCNHVQFVDRIGDTFRWKAQNVSTTEVEEALNVLEDVSMASVYGVKIPFTDGRAGMASLVINTNLKDFNLNRLLNHFKANLPYYAIPMFLRFKPNLAITSTFKFKKGDLKKESFNLDIIDDPIYILHPEKQEYVPLTQEIHENIKNKKYKF
ncbi:MAG: long-chain-acyl-CoA synthetase [Candidatus Thorarchaeota archaeon]